MEKEFTPEMLLKLHPGTYWSVYRLGFAEAKSDPETQKQIAEKYLRSELVKGSFSAATTQLSPASPRQSSPQSPAVTISAEQARINKQLGLNEADFLRYHNAGERRLV